MRAFAGVATGPDIRSAARSTATAAATAPAPATATATATAAATTARPGPALADLHDDVHRILGTRTEACMQIGAVCILGEAAHGELAALRLHAGGALRIGERHSTRLQAARPAVLGRRASRRISELRRATRDHREENRDRAQSAR